MGASINIETLYGTTSIIIEPGTNPGQKIKIIGQGIPYLPPNNNQKGDHIITFNIFIQKDLTDKQKKIYKELANEEDSITYKSAVNKINS